MSIRQDLEYLLYSKDIFKTDLICDIIDIFEKRIDEKIKECMSFVHENDLSITDMEIINRELGLLFEIKENMK